MYTAVISAQTAEDWDVIYAMVSDDSGVKLANVKLVVDFMVDNKRTMHDMDMSREEGFAYIHDKTDVPVADVKKVVDILISYGDSMPDNSGSGPGISMPDSEYAEMMRLQTQLIEKVQNNIDADKADITLVLVMLVNDYGNIEEFANENIDTASTLAAGYLNNNYNLPPDMTLPIIAELYPNWDTIKTLHEMMTQKEE